jgi:hypothetical protein
MVTVQIDAEGFFVVNATSSATVFTYEAKSTVTPSREAI